LVPELLKRFLKKVKIVKDGPWNAISVHININSLKETQRLYDEKDKKELRRKQGVLFKKFCAQFSVVKVPGKSMNVVYITGFQGVSVVTEDPANPKAPIGIIGDLWVTNSYKTEFMTFFLDSNGTKLYNCQGDEINAINAPEMITQLKEQVKKAKW